jgi:hypothetical protein
MPTILPIASETTNAFMENSVPLRLLREPVVGG